MSLVARLDPELPVPRKRREDLDPVTERTEFPHDPGDQRAGRGGVGLEMWCDDYQVHRVVSRAWW
jgi:hypothetical protein